MEPSEVALLVGLVACFVGAACLSAAEVSLLRLRRSWLVVEAGKGGRRAKGLLKLVDELPLLFNSILLMALLLQVSAATIGGVLAARWFGGLGATLAAVMITATLFVYAEAIPKAKALQAPHRVALAVTPGLALLVPATRPLVSALVWLTNLHIGPTPVTLGPLTEEEILLLAHESAAAGEIGAGDVALVHRSFEFNDRCAGDVMVPAEEIVAVGVGTPIAEALRIAIDAGHRRLPVYGLSLDDVIGAVRLRDLAAAPTGTQLSTLLADVVRCPAGRSISHLLKQMQAEQCWLAIVTDAGHHTVGLVTVEDVLAELVGEIADEREAGH